MEKINHIIKMANLSAKSEDAWMISEALRQVNATDELICTAICKYSNLNEYISQSDLRKLVGAVGVLIINDLNNPNLKISDMTIEEQLLTLINTYIQSENAHNKAYNEEPNITKQKIDNYKQILNDFSKIKKNNFISIGINIEKLNELIKLTAKNIEKLENELKANIFFNLSDFEIVSEQGHYVAYDKNGNFVLSDDTRRDVETSLEEEYTYKIKTLFKNNDERKIDLNEER